MGKNQNRFFTFWGSAVLAGAVEIFFKKKKTAIGFFVFFYIFYSVKLGAFLTI
jgi:hypothetical protein